MTDLHNLNKDTPAKPNEAADRNREDEQTHQRVEREAMKNAKRGKEREREEDGDEFSNIGPV